MNDVNAAGQAGLDGIRMLSDAEVLGSDADIVAESLRQLIMRDQAEKKQSDFDIRLKCLNLALEAAKLGVVANIYKTADRYFRFVIGEPVDDPTAGLSFEARLDMLASEFLASERSDGRAIKHALATFYERMDNAYPDLPTSSSVPSPDYLDTLDAANRSPR